MFPLTTQVRENGRRSRVAFPEIRIAVSGELISHGMVQFFYYYYVLFLLYNYPYSKVIAY